MRDIIFIITTVVFFITTVFFLFKFIKTSALLSGVTNTFKGNPSDAMKEVNAFIRREFMFEMAKYLYTEHNVKVAKNGSVETSILDVIKSGTFVRESLSKIQSEIMNRMGSNIKAAFYLSYKKESLYEYVSRQLFYFVKRINADLTSLIMNRKDVKLDEVVGAYILAFESENFTNNDIETISGIAGGNETNQNQMPSK